MTGFLHLCRKSVLFAAFPAFVIFVVTLTLSVKTSTQQLQVASQGAKDALLRQIENWPAQPLRTVETTDSPFRIIEAQVKEIPGFEFTKLTGKTTDLGMVSSVPEVKLMNTSGKTITGFILAIRDPHSRTTRVLSQQKVAIPPGGTYAVKREHFVDPELLTVAGSEGTFRQKRVQPRLDSEKYWLQFAGRSDVFITVGRVVFVDGTSWTIKEGGEVR